MREEPSQAYQLNHYEELEGWSWILKYGTCGKSSRCGPGLEDARGIPDHFCKCIDGSKPAVAKDLYSGQIGLEDARGIPDHKCGSRLEIKTKWILIQRFFITLVNEESAAYKGKSSAK